MADRRPARGLIDTSVVIDLERLDADDLPQELAVSAITMAELAAGYSLFFPRPEQVPRRNGSLSEHSAHGRELGLRYRVSNSNSAWHPPQTVMPDELQIQFL